MGERGPLLIERELLGAAVSAARLVRELVDVLEAHHPNPSTWADCPICRSFPRANSPALETFEACVAEIRRLANAARSE